MAAAHNNDLEDYFKERDTIEQSDSHSDDDELSKTPDEGEAEEAWLDKAGYGFIVSKIKDGKDLSDSDLEHLTSSLTRAQAEAVHKRISIVSTTVRRKDKSNKIHVRDIFPSQHDGLPHRDIFTPPRDLHTQEKQNHAFTMPRPSPSRHITKSPEPRSGGFVHKGGYSMSGVSNEITEDVEAGIATLGVHPRTQSRSSPTDQFSHLSSVSDMEISLDFNQEDSDKFQTISPVSTFPDPHRIDLPAFEPKPDALGVTHIGDIAECDMEKIKHLSHIELTALFDAYNIIHSRPKRKKKLKDNGIFGVPLELLIEQDQKRQPGTKTPIVFQKMVEFLEKEGLYAEGILRVSGAETRARQLRQDIEDKFYQGLFTWGDAGVHDVAVVFKQFLRELPIPLLSSEYLDAFPHISSIPHVLEQLKALNLLIILLTDEHRDTLKVLLRFLRNIISHSNRNKMGLNNVAMIMAPNLFLMPSKSNKEKPDLEVELKKAAGTSNIVKMLVTYQDVLWTIPTTFIAQIRHQYTTEAHRKSKDGLLSKFSRKKDRSEVYKKPEQQPEAQDGYIKVQAPNLTKTYAFIALDQSTTAADVVAKFKWDQVSKSSEHSTIGGVEEKAGHTYVNPNNAQYAHDSDCLFEVGGNIAERCLDPRTNMMELHRINPYAEWVIKPRKDR
ncbi:rho GTPase-activating protein 18-like [Physella acuta]|uniref:rho GTPase-activating protein 18-like n=1 Tax=Physella acuta TaxID=109671 RepID=UPI0027DC33C4|nr:rho GTPase-activating protein 18-like [Physella acuta]